MVAWLSKEIHRRKSKRKLTKKEKRILERLQSKVSNKLIKNEDLLKMKEIWLEELRYRKTKLGKMRMRHEKTKKQILLMHRRSLSVPANRQQVGK